MPISKNIKSNLERSSWIRKMFEQGAKLKQKHGQENVFDFSLGNPDLPSPQEFNQELKKQAKKTGSYLHGYMPNSGYPENREKIAEKLSKESGLHFDKNLVTMTVGAAGAMNVALKSILNPGEEVIVFTPYFVEYDFYIQNHQGKKVEVSTTDDLLPDFKELQEKISSNTRAVIINSPNNPTGRIYPKDCLQELGEILAQKSRELNRSIYLLADDPYSKIVYSDAEYRTPLKYYDNTLMIRSFSKDLSLAGERIGYLGISPKADDSEDLIKAASFTNRTLGFVNAPALMQRVIQNVLDVHVDVEKYEERKNVLYDSLTDIGYNIVEPQGTFYMFPKSPIADDIKFVNELQEELILVTPGTGFHKSGYFRISLCLPLEKIKRALPGFEKAYQNSVQ